MIGEAVLGIATGLLNGLLDALPTVPPEDYSGLAALFAQAAALNKYLPVTETLACVGTVLAFNAARVAFWLAGWIYARIPFKAT